MTIEQALAWADQTMNERLREARRTGNDHDYDAAMEGCIDILAAEVRRLREENIKYSAGMQENCALRAEIDRLREANAKVLDRLYTTSCGHQWSMRHTACPDCFAQMTSDLAAERIENTHLREAFVTMERAANEREREVERLRKALADIATHPHSRYDHPENGNAPYGTGCADGHRCAANIARAALKGEGDDCNGTLENTALTALRQRHAAEVKSAYLCGLHEAFTSPSADPEQCWQLSAARRGLAEKGTP